MSRSLSAGVLAAAFLAPSIFLASSAGAAVSAGWRYQQARPLLALAACLEQSLAQALELLVLGVQRLEIGIWRLSSFDLGKHDLGIAQRRPLVEEPITSGGLRRPPFAKRAYFRMVRSSLISAMACSSGVRGSASAGGSSKAAGSRPQSSASPISNRAACALAEKPISVTHRGPASSRRTLRERRDRRYWHPCGLQGRKAWSECWQPPDQRRPELSRLRRLGLGCCRCAGWHLGR